MNRSKSESTSTTADQHSSDQSLKRIDADPDIAPHFFKENECHPYDVLILDLDTGSLLEGVIDTESGLIESTSAGESQPLPKRYVELSRYSGRGVLQRFIASEWTDDAELRAEAYSCWQKCNGRYGPWKSFAPDAAVAGFHELQDRELLEHINSELAEHGFQL